MRGCIEVCLKNALTGEEIIRGSGENAVLYVGRNMLMTRAYTSGTQTNILVPCIMIGSATATANATNTNLGAYYTFKTGGFATTTASDGSVQPILRFTGSWASTELNVSNFNSVREFALAFNTVSNNSVNNLTNPVLCRYVSGSDINATTSNELYVTYTVSF